MTFRAGVRKRKEAWPPTRPPGPVRRALLPVLRLIGEHVRGFYAAVGVFLLAGLALMLVLVIGFTALAEAMVEGHTTRIDEDVLRWMDRNGTATLDVLALEITSLGSGVVVLTMAAVASVFLWVSRHRYSVVMLWVAMLGSAILSSTLKAFFDRERPQIFPWRTPHAGEASFPSGHSMTAMVGYATLAYLIARLEPSPLLRRLTFGVAALIIVLVGLTRMYLGVHWPSDVLGGFAIGLAWASFCALGIEAVRYFRTRRPEVAHEEKGIAEAADGSGGSAGGEETAEVR